MGKRGSETTRQEIAENLLKEYLRLELILKAKTYL